jgi:chromosome partitioning protein
MANTNRILSACVYVEKGGVAKTTSAAHMAVAAATHHDLDVILIDLAGNQNDLATQFGITDVTTDIDAPISAVFGSDWQFIQENIPDIVDRMVFDTGEGPDLIPSDAGLGGADNQLADVALEDRYVKLQDFVDNHLRDRYDLVLFDLPGKEDNIALNGLFAARNVIAPLKPGAFERDQLHSLEHTLDEITTDHQDTLQQTRSGGHTDLHLELVFASDVDRRQNLDVNFADELEAEYPNIVGTVVPHAANIGSGQDLGQTLFAFDDDLYDTGKRARTAYRKNTTQLLDRIQTHAQH